MTDRQSAGRLRVETELETQRQRVALELISSASVDRGAWRSGAPASLVAALRARGQ